MQLKPVVNVVDGDPSALEAMSVLLQSIALEVACYDSPDAFLEGWEIARPGCLILDLCMPGMGGLELQNALRERGTPISIIFLTEHGNVSAAVCAIQQGAVHVLTKPVDDAALLGQISKAIEFDRESRVLRQARETIQARFDLLTPREYEVMEGVVAGKSSKQIARELGISPKTVQLHRAHMTKKMHAASIAELVQMRLSSREMSEGGGLLTEAQQNFHYAG